MCDTLKVEKIKDGTVIDHIPATRALNCLKFIGLEEGKSTILALNVTSARQGRKDILKLENVFPDKEIIDKIALIAPSATINTIKDFQVVEKRKVEYPKRIVGGIICINPNCSTRNEPNIKSKYMVESIEPLKLRCEYCDRFLIERDVISQF